MAALVAFGLLSPGGAAPKDASRETAGRSEAGTLGDRTVTVVSEARASADPDLGVLVFDFAAYGWTVDRSRRKVDDLIQKFLDKLSEAKIVPTQVQVGDVKLKPSYQFNRDLKAHVPSDFLVTRRVNLFYQDLSGVGKILDKSLSLGSFLLVSARMTVKDKPGLEALALKNALEESRRKAEAVAESVDRKVGEVLSVEELDTRVEDLNLIQDNDWAALAAGILKPEPQGDAAPEAEGNLALPEKSAPAKANFPEEALKVGARARLRVTFSLR